MATTVTIKSVNKLQNAWMVTGSIALSGSYPATGHGDILSLITDQIKAHSVPSFVEINDAPPAGTVASGFNFSYTPGADLSTGKLQILTASTGATVGGQELTPGTAYSATTPSLAAAVLQFMAIIPSL